MKKLFRLTQLFTFDKLFIQIIHINLEVHKILGVSSNCHVELMHHLFSSLILESI
uniref:Uncharacterized protein n=1 Tax=Rhizophora mucronata TaxID=61149 RepID=A0A2P2P9K3_RHIMU